MLALGLCAKCFASSKGTIRSKAEVRVHKGREKGGPGRGTTVLFPRSAL